MFKNILISRDWLYDVAIIYIFFIYDVLIIIIQEQKYIEHIYSYDILIYFNL